MIPFSKRNSDIMHSDFDDIHNILDRYFAEDTLFKRSPAAVTFIIDVQDNETEYLVKAELPGIRKEDINISIDKGRLGISVKKEQCHRH